MAELLIRIIDKDQPDPVLAISSSKRGDVIGIQEDGWSWSEAEKTHPEWVIVRTDLTVEQQQQLLASPQPQPFDPANPPKPQPFRTHGINLDVLSGTPPASPIGQPIVQQPVGKGPIGKGGQTQGVTVQADPVSLAVTMRPSPGFEVDATAAAAAIVAK